MSLSRQTIDRRYQAKRHPLTSTLTVEEYVRFVKMAKDQGKLPTPYATEIIRQKIAEQELETRCLIRPAKR